MKNFTFPFLLSLLSWFAQPLVASEPLNISLVKLISNPKDYDGKLVRIIGFVRLEFEGNGIYLNQDDYKHSIYKNGLWLDTTPDMEKRQSELNLKHVLIEGTFNARMAGHMGLWSGSIEKITRCEVWK